MFKIIAIIGFCCVGYNVTAQVSATAAAGATIVLPVGTYRQSILEFADFTPGVRSASITIVEFNGTIINGDARIAPGAGQAKLATFKIVGQHAYSVIMPPDLLLKKPTAHNYILINNFSARSPAADQLTIGATVSLSGGQASGVYLNQTPFEVIVSYN